MCVVPVVFPKRHAHVYLAPHTRKRTAEIRSAIDGLFGQIVFYTLQHTFEYIAIVLYIKMYQSASLDQDSNYLARPLAYDAISRVVVAN